MLTHGEMLSERIAFQISEIGQSSTGKVKCEILRKVCFADVCGIRLSISKLFTNQSEDCGEDFGEIIKSMESEFLVHVNNEGGYIEGLHPIRSMHIVNKLHEFLPIDWTAGSVIEIAKKEDYPILFSHLPEFDLNKSDFFSSIVEKLWNEQDLSHYISAIQGLFSGSVMQYYRSNLSVFNDANSHGGLFIISTEVCPFASFSEFGLSVDILDKMKEIMPENENIKYLCKLRDSIPTCDLHETFVYTFCDCLYRKLLQFNFSRKNDISSYAALSEWIYNIDPVYNLSIKFPLDYIWKESEMLSLDCISTLMYISFCGNKDTYEKFVIKNLDFILGYLKRKTKSHKIYIDGKKNAVHVEYILRLSDIKIGNEESVSRLKYICRTLPIYDLYCSDALKPILNLLSAYTIPDDAHKEMPIRNIVIMFHQNLTSLWNKTIMSNYEFDTVTEWLEYWFDIRKRICLLADKCCAYYQTHFANKYLNKYEIKDWYEADRRAKRKTVEEGLSRLLPKYSIHFPDEIYTTDMLSYYPIIVDNFDMSSESNWIEWLIGCTPFANSPFDYLVILYTNESGRVNPTALQFPKRMLIEVKKAIESEDYSLLEKLAPPYPVDVTVQMLDCFIEKYTLPAENKPDINVLPIGDIAEELWIYSMSKELLANPEDAVYLSTELQRIQTNVSGMLHSLEGKLPSEDIDQISDTCKKVFEGNKFDDVLLNEFIENFVQQNINAK